MNRLVTFGGLLAAAALAACGDNAKPPGPLVYADPSGGALRLVKDPAATGTAMVLDFVVGDQPLTGYATGFDLPLDAAKVTLGPFTPGTALLAGSDPVSAAAALPTAGPLAGALVTAQSQKATGAGAVATDSSLPPGTVLYKVELDVVPGAAIGDVFDGTAPGFVLRSGGLRNRAGLTVVAEKDVAIGKLEVVQ